MLTYRLQFSADASIFERRLKKALACNPERVLGVGFAGAPPLLPSNHGQKLIWTWEGPHGAEAPSGWDEYHWILRDPGSPLLRLKDKEFLVAQPQDRRHRLAWLTFFKSLPSEVLRTKIFVEFAPWTKKDFQKLTSFEVAHFLYELKFHIPDWTPQRRGGVELWNPFIPEECELEPSCFTEKNYGFQPVLPEVSVIVPTYNNKNFLTKTVESLAKQTLDVAQFEVIVVDDGGSDATLEHILTFGVHGRLQLKYIHWPKQQDLFRAGLCRNLGVQESRGRNLVFLDSDMIVPKNFLQQVLEELKHQDVLQFPRRHISQEKSSSATRVEKLQTSDLYIEEESYWRPFFETKNWMGMEKFWKYTCTYGLALSRKSFFEAGRFCRFYVSYGFEDTNLGYRLALLGKRFKMVPLELLHLTSYSHSQYQLSKFKRHYLLQKTAKLFFLNTLDLKVFEALRGFMGGEPARRERFKKALYSLGKNTTFDETRSAWT